MRDRTAARNYSPAAEEFRREHERHRAWGLIQRRGERLRHLRDRACAAPPANARTHRQDPPAAPVPTPPERQQPSATSRNTPAGQEFAPCGATPAAAACAPSGGASASSPPHPPPAGPGRAGPARRISPRPVARPEHQPPITAPSDITIDLAPGLVARHPGILPRRSGKREPVIRC